MSQAGRRPENWLATGSSPGEGGGEGWREGRREEG